MPWSQHWHQAWPMGRGVRNHPASPYPRPSARVLTEAGRVRVSGPGQGFAHGCVTNSCARRWQVLALIPLQHPTEARAWWYFRGQAAATRLPDKTLAVTLPGGRRVPAIPDPGSSLTHVERIQAVVRGTDML